MSKKTEPTRCAVIGTGAIGPTHAACYARNADAELTCVVDLVEAKARAVAERHGVRTVLTDYRRMLADPSIDAVSVCLPNHLHAPVTIECLNAGKHVLCEKPIAMSLDEAQAMREAAERNGRQLAIGLVNRYNDTVNFIRRTIAQGQLGKVYHVSTVFRAHRSIPGLGRWFTTRAESGGGVMMDWGVHFLDLILYCLGGPEPVSISGAAYGKLGANLGEYAYMDMWAGPPDYDGVCDVDDYVTGLLRTRGPSVAFEGAWAQNVGESAMWTDFLGEKAGMRHHYLANVVMYGYRDGVLYKTEPSLRKTDHFQNEIDAFVRSCRTGEKCSSDITEVMPVQRVIDAFYRSAEQNRELPV